MLYKKSAMAITLVRRPSSSFRGTICYQAEKIATVEQQCQYRNLLDAKTSTNGGVQLITAKLQGPYRSVRTGSFFAKSNLSLQKYLLVLLHWAYDDQMSEVAERVKLSLKTSVQCLQYIRDVCSWRLMQSPIRLGGTLGLIPRVCEIDESCFSHKPKVILSTSSSWTSGVAYCLYIFSIIEGIPLINPSGYLE
jgi:hypothetical protein